MSRSPENRNHDRFYVIFRELDRLASEAEARDDISRKEFDEINQLRKIVNELSSDKPSFYTST